MIITLQYFGGFDMNQPWVHMCLPILNPLPTSLSTQSFWVVPEHQRSVPCFMHRTCTVHLFYVWYYTSFNAILSNHSTLILFHIVQNSVLYTCVSFAAFPYRILVTIFLNSVQFSSVQFAQSCLTLRPHGIQHTRPPVHHQLPEFTQTHVL